MQIPKDLRKTITINDLVSRDNAEFTDYTSDNDVIFILVCWFVISYQIQLKQIGILATPSSFLNASDESVKVGITLKH